jgi:VCBS repeat-containing protein
MGGKLARWSVLLTLVAGLSGPSPARAATPMPIANDDSYQTGTEATLSVDAQAGVLANDTDAVAATLVNDVSDGTLSLAQDGSFTYVPNLDFEGTDDFTYYASHGSTQSNVATVTIAVDDPPVAADDAYATGVGATLVVGVPGVLGNDTDPNGDSLIASIIGKAANGSVTSFRPDGSFKYVPNPGFKGTDSFTYKASDGTRDSPATKVTITVDDPPVGADDAYATGVGATLVVGVPGVLANDADPNGDSLTASIIASPPKGSLTSFRPDGSFKYVPDPGFKGTDHFTYKASDGSLDGAATTVTITVDDPPSASGDGPFTAHRGVILTVDKTLGVLANDSDPNSDLLKAVLDAGAAHGKVSLRSDGSFLYTAEAGFKGPDRFTYHASDGIRASAIATVDITVVNDAPVAVDDVAYRAAGGTTLAVDRAHGVLANDSDLNHDRLTAALVDDANRGTLKLNPNGSFSYRPDAGVCNAFDEFTYHAGDGDLTSGRATATITIATPLEPATLSVRLSAPKVIYGQGVLVTAHLTGFSPSAVISIYGRPAGGTSKLLKQGRADSHGNLALQVHPPSRTTYSARSTDNCFQAASSDARIVQVAPRVSGRMLGFFDRRGAYALYHREGRVPHYRAAVSPIHPGAPVVFRWQRLARGTWRRYFETKDPIHLGKGSSINVYLTSGVVAGVRYRVKIFFLADDDHLAAASRWKYFMSV